MSDEEKDVVELIGDYTAGLLDKYQRIKDGDKSIPFWDQVVLCCTDDTRIEAAFARSVAALSLPSAARYRVLPDPPGVRIEGGGATMHALAKLREEFGDQLDEMRVLVIQAGGFSKRLVHHAVLGKLFSMLPLGKRGLSVLELKLAMYLPFAALLPRGGMLTTSCDDLQLCWLPERPPDDLFPTKPDGFVTPSHPAPLSTAVNHGVYVLPPGEKSGNQYVFSAPCEEVLQKPSEQLMRERGAVFMQDGRETVQIDGAVWAGPAAMRALEALYVRLRPLNEEVSVWRDFLPSGGRRRPGHYESVEVPRLPADSARRITFDALLGVPLTVLAVPRSRFYHLGTLPEYLHHLAGGGELARVLRLRRWCHARGQPQDGVVMYSALCPHSRVPASAMVEFCRLQKVEVGDGSLLSHCHVEGPERVPAHVLLHTAAVTWRGRRQYVALGMGMQDPVKEAPALLAGRPVAHTTGPLWSARLFEAADTMAQAAAATLRRLTEAQPQVADDLWSMEDVMKHWDPMAMLDFRDELDRLVDGVEAADKLEAERSVMQGSGDCKQRVEPNGV
ncbi:Fucose-1-phosphate guanylyltransferase [Amphibalanus amphitrite]|uniref:Fucose-1-phosphate guanylyltransferase n=1 Tax=Amphibalanus amphitrite TaxID=1232801 RepID=A0A6A4WGG9_AMPAM|nr:fucose-1-phosphate guanylyltransferase-like [Amphibalanus amphitrite]KAF0301090.1 Fucose-1-phosphate guanylyltransferase [Amphibalanus amphitrite]KAF0301091.1 Fucose-1-phosphate guanylyltransferase [Amphibalanus amphitrite]